MAVLSIVTVWGAGPMFSSNPSLLSDRPAAWIAWVCHLGRALAAEWATWTPQLPSNIL